MSEEVLIRAVLARDYRVISRWFLVGCRIGGTECSAAFIRQLGGKSSGVACTRSWQMMSAFEAQKWLMSCSSLICEVLSNRSIKRVS
jgi:hypothetical protein